MFINAKKVIDMGLENKEILSDEILMAIDMIIAKCPHAVFGGSIALNAVGLINRKVSDIDVFFEDGSSLQKNGFLEIQSDITLSDTVTDTNGKLVQRTGAKINDVKVCVFKVCADELQHSFYSFLGRKIKIQNVNYAIMAKKSYSAKNPKHTDDLNVIEDFLNSLPI